MPTKRKLVHRPLFIVAASLGTLLTGAAHADDEKLVPFSEFRVTQFYQLSADQPMPFVAGTPSDFSELVGGECSSPVREQKLAAFPAAVAAVVLKWVVTSGLKIADKKLATYIKEHTATYANALRFDDFFDAHLWSLDKTPRSCIVAQRLICKLPADEARSPLAHCESGRPALSFAAELRNEGDHLRVLPLALDVRELKARNAGKEAAVAVHLQLWGIGHSKAGDVRWSSGEVALASETFAATRSKGGSTPTLSTAALDRRYLKPGKDNFGLWAAAPVLPMPPRLKRPAASPRSVVAVEVRVGEVGEPGKFAKLASSFLGGASDDLTGVLVTAAKDKWGPKED